MQPAPHSTHVHPFAHATVQLDGAALTMPKAHFVDAYHPHPHMRNLVNRYQAMLLMQARQNAACSALHTCTPIRARDRPIGRRGSDDAQGALCGRLSSASAHAEFGQPLSGDAPDASAAKCSLLRTPHMYTHSRTRPSNWTARL